MGRVLLALLAVVLATLSAEIVLRCWTPERIRTFGSPRALPGEGAFTADDELGYRPVMDGPEYGPFGTLRNDYRPEKPSGVRRLLFLGDSVTRRGFIQAGLRTLLGDEGFEYWTAGVDGYATAQEAAYYRRFCAALHADRVVLTLHLNDFESTPVTIREGDHLVRLFTRGSWRGLNPWLLQHSFLYRGYLSYRLGAEAGTAREALTASAEIERALVELRAGVERNGGALTVLVLPWLRPVTKWPGNMAPRRSWILATLARLGIEHYDFVPALEAALAQGLPVTETPYDPQHPSPEFGLCMARALLAAGFVP